MGVDSATGQKVVDKIAGNGILYCRKGDVARKFQPIGKTGSGLFLHSTWKGAKNVNGNGFFIKNHGSGYEQVGAGLILGVNSPFKNILVLGWLL
jgi:hypothetical protein